MIHNNGLCSIWYTTHTHTHKYGSQVTNDRVRSKMFVILVRSEFFKIYILQPSFSSSSHLSSSSKVVRPLWRPYNLSSVPPLDHIWFLVF